MGTNYRTIDEAIQDAVWRAREAKEEKRYPPMRRCSNTEDIQRRKEEIDRKLDLLDGLEKVRSRNGYNSTWNSGTSASGTKKPY